MQKFIFKSKSSLALQREYNVIQRKNINILRGPRKENPAAKIFKLPFGTQRRSFKSC